RVNQECLGESQVSALTHSFERFAFPACPTLSRFQETSHAPTLSPCTSTRFTTTRLSADVTWPDRLQNRSLLSSDLGVFLNKRRFDFAWAAVVD
ncbi:MAG: hypothetical protein ACF787_04610, partial [Rhodopirellula sp. JB053]